MGKIGSTGEIDYCMGGCYLNDQNGHFLGFHPTNGQLHLPVGAETVLTDFMDGSCIIACSFSTLFTGKPQCRRNQI